MEPPKAPRWSEGGKATDKQLFGTGSGQLTVAPKLSGPPVPWGPCDSADSDSAGLGGGLGVCVPIRPQTVLDTERTRSGWEGLARTQQADGGVGVGTHGAWSPRHRPDAQRAAGGRLPWRSAGPWQWCWRWMGVSKATARPSSGDGLALPAEASHLVLFLLLCRSFSLASPATHVPKTSVAFCILHFQLTLQPELLPLR